MFTSEDGARSQVYLAASQDVIEQKINGQYFHPIAKRVTPSELVTKENAAKMWEFSEELLKQKDSGEKTNLNYIG